MKYIKIFLAMSEEDMGAELNELSDYIRSLNDLYIGRSIFFELCMPGETDADDIDESQYFFLLFYRDADEQIVEDFDIALKKFNDSETPKIVTYFKIAEEDGSISEGVRSFMERLEKGLEHFYNKFDNIDTVKLSMLLEMARNQETKLDIEFIDGKVLADKKEVGDISLDNIPQYFKNEALNKLREERLRLEKEYVELRTAIKADPDDDELFRKLYDVNERKNKTDEQFHQMEMDILRMTSTIVEMTSDGKPLTVRAKKAIEYFNAGDYENCKDVLDDEERKQAWEKVDEKEAAQKVAIETVMNEEREGLINEIRIKIDTIKAQGINNESEKEIIELYEEAKEKIFEHDLNLELAIDYVGFLWDQKRVHEGIELGEHIYSIIERSNDLNEEKLGGLLLSLGHLYSEVNDLKSAEKFYNELMSMHKSLAYENCAYEIGVALCYINQGDIYNDLKKYDEAENTYRKALNILEEYNKIENEDLMETVQRNIALIWNNMGALFYGKRNYKEAGKNYKCAMNIYNNLIERYGSNDEKMNYELACIYENLGLLYGNYFKQYAESERNYLDALGIYKELSETNRSAYISDVAMNCGKLGILYQRTGRYKEAEKKYREALEIYEELNVESGAYVEMIKELSVHIGRIDKKD